MSRQAQSYIFDIGISKHMRPYLHCHFLCHLVIKNYFISKNSVTRLVGLNLVNTSNSLSLGTKGCAQMSTIFSPHCRINPFTRIWQLWSHSRHGAHLDPVRHHPRNNRCSINTWTNTLDPDSEQWKQCWVWISDHTVSQSAMTKLSSPNQLLPCLA